MDREQGLIAIKPSGVEYEKLEPSDLVITDLDGRVVEGQSASSSDLPTHLVLYKIVSDNRRRGAYPLGIRYGVGAGAKFRAVLRNYACRLVSRSRTGYRVDERTGDRIGYEENTGRAIVCTRRPRSYVNPGGTGCEPRPVYVGPRCLCCRSECGHTRGSRSDGLFHSRNQPRCRLRSRVRCMASTFCESTARTLLTGSRRIRRDADSLG